MIDLFEKRFLKYVLFFNLYASEGLIIALSTTTTVLYFNVLNIPISTTTLVSGIINIPWILKFLPGPIIDFFIKKGRKPFIILGGVTASLSLFSLTIIDPSENLIPFILIFFIGHLGIITLDVSADAWAIQTSKYEERGKINAAMTSGLFFCWALGGIFFAYIGQTFSYKLNFIIVGFIIILTLILPLIVKEVIIVKQHQKIGKTLIKEFKKKKTLLITALEFFSAMNFGILLLIIPDYIKNVFLLDDFQTGIIASIYPVSIVIGAVVGGWLTDKYSRKPIIFITCTGALIFSALLIFADSWEILAFLYTIIGLLTGAGVYAAVAALAMDIVNPKIGATQHSILASIHNFGEIGIAMISGALVFSLGYHRFFLYSALVIGPVLLILYLIKEKNND